MDTHPTSAPVAPSLRPDPTAMTVLEASPPVAQQQQQPPVADADPAAADLSDPMALSTPRRPADDDDQDASAMVQDQAAGGESAASATSGASACADADAAMMPPPQPPSQTARSALDAPTQSTSDSSAPATASTPLPAASSTTHESTPAAAAASAASSAAAASGSAAAAAPAAAAAADLGPPLPADTQRDLDSLLFGPPSNCSLTDVSRWRTQGFLFSQNARTLFGLTQTAGGPCGVLAPVQAFILQRLLFGGVVAAAVNSDIPLSPSPAQQDEALVWALSTIITRSTADTQQSGFVLVSGTEQSLHVHRVATAADVTAFWAARLPQLHGPMGVLTFVYSLLLSRGLETVRSDMDDAESYLVGAFGHSAQELVNLCLVGRAVTNVFDGNKVLGDANDPSAFRLKGIPQQNEIGFLTLHEALRYSVVGEHLKSPKVPIWVVGSANHYTVIFSLDRRVGALSAAQKKNRLARSAFDELDPENNGFVAVSQLDALLRKLNASIPAGMSRDDVQRRLDPDGLGLLLYERVLTVLDQWEKQKAQLAAAAVPNRGPFSCQACTFYNDVATAQTCEICGTPRPPPAAVAAAASASSRAAEESIVNFTLYHFNGIEIPNPADPSRPKSACECVRVNVSVVEGGLPPQIQGDAISEQQGLKEILLTRWPSCILDVEGVAKIS